MTSEEEGIGHHYVVLLLLEGIVDQEVEEAEGTTIGEVLLDLHGLSLPLHVEEEEEGEAGTWIGRWITVEGVRVHAVLIDSTRVEVQEGEGGTTFGLSLLLSVGVGVGVEVGVLLREIGRGVGVGA